VPGDGAQGAQPAAVTYKETEVEDGDGRKLPGLYREFPVSPTKTGSLTLGIRDGRLFPVYVENGGVSGSGAIRTAYEQAIAEAKRRGLQFTSDASVTLPASRVYDKLKDAGVDVRKNPAARLAQKPEVTTPRWVTDDGSPVYTVGPAPAKAPTVEAESADAEATRKAEAEDMKRRLEALEKAQRPTPEAAKPAPAAPKKAEPSKPIPEKMYEPTGTSEFGMEEGQKEILRGPQAMLFPMTKKEEI
jgi:hypothetical protein